MTGKTDTLRHNGCMLFIVIIGALAAAFFNASSAVLQRRASGKVNPKRLFKGSFVLEVARNKMWMAGMGLQVLAFLVQAAALKNGSLIIVEPLMTADLVFLLLILQLHFGLGAGRREWAGVVGVCAGLSGLLIAANPRGGHITFDWINWAITACIIALLAMVAALVVRRSPSGTFRAAIAGTAAGASFALTSAFTKLALQQLDHGFLHFISTWEVYALIVSGAVSIVLMQSAYSAGPLAASQPAVEITDPAVSTAIGIVLFGDIVNHGPFDLLVELACTLLLVAGVVLLTGSERIHAAGKKGV